MCVRIPCKYDSSSDVIFKNKIKHTSSNKELIKASFNKQSAQKAIYANHDFNQASSKVSLDTNADYGMCVSKIKLSTHPNLNSDRGIQETILRKEMRPKSKRIRSESKPQNNFLNLEKAKNLTNNRLLSSK